MSVILFTPHKTRINMFETKRTEQVQTVQELKYIHNQVLNDGQLISPEKMEYAPSRLYSAEPTVAVQYKLT